MALDSITNRGEFFSNHYLAAIISNDINTVRKLWDELEGRDEPSPRSRLRAGARDFFTQRAAATEAGRTQQATEVRRLNDITLRLFGFDSPNHEGDHTEFARADGTDTLVLDTAMRSETSTGLLAVAIDAGLATDVDQLVATTKPGRDDIAGHPDTPHLLLAAGRRTSEKNERIEAAADAVSELFSIDDPPRYVLVLGGRVVLLAERAKWAEGRFLAVDLDAALDRMDTSKGGEIETIAALFSAEALTPTDGQSTLDELADKSHKHAVGVSKDLRHGIRHSIEILANATIEQLDRQARDARQKQFSCTEVDARNLTTQCLRWVYRLLVLLYAESRAELGILPVNDEAYMEGYSLDRLRELCLVDLDTDRARGGSHLDQSLKRLFQLVNDGYHADAAEQQLIFDVDHDAEGGLDYLQFPGLHAQLFEPEHTELLDRVTLPNETLQQVLSLLMLTPEGKQKGKKRADRGFISYAQLGINQLGAVYEGLMAYTGFFADHDLFEVAKNGDPSGGTWMLPVTDADGYPDDVFVSRTDEVTGEPVRILHPKGSFVFRLSGRDRQRSASYYTPEVLTRCVVKHALAELLGLDDYAPENGSSGITHATDMLDLTICEPALGSGAFANEAINQLSAEYLKRRQAELGETLDPDRYLRELQKVRAHFALHQTYGVDLNATAVELAEVSLWLNAMYPGLKAPWFGLQLRRGNSLIGCRRATWRADQLPAKPWKETRKDRLAPPVDRKLDTPLEPDEIHHFLLPGHGWAAVADRKEAKELRETETKALKQWRATILKAPSANDTKRLAQLAAAVEQMWQLATARIEATQGQLRRGIDVYGTETTAERSIASRDDAYGAIKNPDTALGRLRTLMDAWIGLWFWPLDTGITPPTWNQWLEVVETLVRPDKTHGLTGQLDIFSDYQAMLDADEARVANQATVDELRDRHPWLTVALDAAEREGAWHWDLEFAPVFRRGGFDLQVGNPPWVKPSWLDDLVLAEHDPWWGITEKAPAAVQKQRRIENLTEPEACADYLAELASAGGVVEIVGSPVLRSVLTGVQTNLYMVFMDTVWRHLGPTGIAALLHPEGHFSEPKGVALRRQCYARLRRHFQFLNMMLLFEDLQATGAFSFSVNVYGSGRESIAFVNAAMIMHPSVIDGSLEHDGCGPLPSIQFPSGGWDLRPHRSRLVPISEVELADWAKLFDEPGTPASEARLLRPLTVADLEALSVLAAQPTRLADHNYHWTRGHEEDRAKTDGIIRWETSVPSSWDEVILQGPHFTVATPFAKQPNENCKHNQDYSEWELETLPERVIPRTNYQRACPRDDYDANLDHWNGTPATKWWRHVHREMSQPGLERSVQGAIVGPGTSHIHACLTYGFENAADLARWAGLMASLPFDYLFKASGAGHVAEHQLSRIPFPYDHALDGAMTLRALRLNCLTADYAPLWKELFHPPWQDDRWTDPEFTRLHLEEVGPLWSMDTPLRRDFERRLALVELDALAALMLGLSAEQLCAMYRTQFAVLRKYEYKMVFDSEGRKICGYHQSAGFLQSKLQDQAKANELPGVDNRDWKNLWNLYEKYEDDPSSVDWQAHYKPPFTRANREQEMTRAYTELQRRLEVGDYE